MSKIVNGISKAIFYFIIAVFIIIGLLATLGVFNGESKAEDNSNEYVISNYNFTANVNQNNTIEVEENISATFKISGKHGIFRAVPIISTYSFIDENGDPQTSKKLRMNYDVTYSNRPCETETSGDFLYIRLGSADSTYMLNGSDTFSIKYTITLDSRYAFNDFFYFNALGNLWDTTIDNFNGRVNFEKPIDTTNLKIYVGTFGSNSTITPTISADNKSISFNKSDIDVGEGITLYTDLPENYFIMPFVHITDIIMFILLLLSAIIIWRSFSKNSNKNFVIPVVQFKLDKDYTSADVGYIVDKKVNNKDIASLIILWAQKGYLNIIEEGKNTFIQKKGDVDGKMKSYEKSLFNEIFKNTAEGEKVDIKKVGEKIVDVVASTKLQIVADNAPLFNEKANALRIGIIVIATIMYGLSLFLINYQNANMLFAYLSIPAGLLVGSFLTILMINRNKQYVLDEKGKIFRIVGFIIIFITLLAFSILSYDPYCDLLFSSFLSILLVLLATTCVYKFNIRSDKGVRELGDIVGLRNFILTAEKDRMEMLAKENPQMFYDVMPYAYVMEVYDTWCKKFEGIALDKPDWYSGDSLTDALHFNYMFSSITTSILSSINTAEIAARAESIAKSAGKISGGGGGFSGGGIGGGGGGSW